MSVFLESGWGSLAKFGEELCGDSVELVKTSDSLVAVLADGLGSGVKANILSTMTAKIIATMIKEGADLPQVVETVSDTLPVCQKRHLAYSTFTIIQIKTDGSVYLVEFDNPAVFYLHRGYVQQIPAQEIEICGKRVKESRFQVTPGDYLVAVSDGVIHAGVGGILNLGWQWLNVAEYLERLTRQATNAANLSNWLLQATQQLYGERPGDDATVLTVGIRYPKSTTLAVGPPSDPADDAVMVKLLRQETGRKVVCGGTTGLIVARELHVEPSVDVSHWDPLLPPVGQIPGIDLATEGIITLSKFREYLAVPKSIPEAGADGAKQLYQLLIDSDLIHFVVGRAVNPAHQNPDLPMNLALKIPVIEEIATRLKARGKEVTIQYF